MTKEDLVHRMISIYITASMAKDIGNVYGIANRRKMASNQRIKRRTKAIQRKFAKELSLSLLDEADLFSKDSDVIDCPPKIIRAAVFYERSKILRWVIHDGGTEDWYKKNTDFKDRIMGQIAQAYDDGIHLYQFDTFLGSVDDPPIYKNGIEWNDDRPFVCTALFRNALYTLQQIRDTENLDERQKLASQLPISYLAISSVQDLIANGTPAVTTSFDA